MRRPGAIEFAATNLAKNNGFALCSLAHAVAASARGSNGPRLPHSHHADEFSIRTSANEELAAAGFTRRLSLLVLAPVRL